jgi:hypothetical protein
MFVVAITLGLLAAMGVYGLSATASDLRSAGHVREALHGRSAGEHALMTTAEAMNPSSAAALVAMMTAGNTYGQSTNCRTAAAYSLTTVSTRDAQACIVLDMPKMQRIANSTGAPLWPEAMKPFEADSFGPLYPTPPPYAPVTRVEVTNPVDVLSADGKSSFKRVTVTTFIEMRDATVPNSAPAQTIVTGRGRLTVGPISAGGGGGRIFDF